MTAGTMMTSLSWPRIERAGWFWIFVVLSVAVHAVFLWRATWERAAVAVDSAPQVMSVRMVEVRPAPPEPVVEPEPVVVPPRVIEPEPVITRSPEPAVVPMRPEPAAVAARPKPAAPKVAAVAPPKPSAPAFVEARPASNRPPHYPELARRNSWQGLCMVRVKVGADGRPGGVSVARSSGYGILDQAALTAVKRWKFSPRMVRGVASASTVEVPVNFSLR